MRELVSGRDFQLRYALHRLTLLALGADPLHDRAARMRLEWPIATGGDEVWADAVIEDEEGGILEIIECKEHANHITPKSIRTFFADARRLAAVAPSARFRFVTNARHLPDGTRPSRRKPPVDPARIAWELDTPRKESLSAECIAHFAQGGGDPRSLYVQLYTRLAAQAAARLKRDGDVFIAAVQEIHAWLFADIDAALLSSDLMRDAETSFAVAELRAILQRRRSPRRQALDASREAVAALVNSGLLSDSAVTLSQIFIDSAATTNVSGTDSGRSWTDSALSLLFQWLATSRTNGGGRLAGRSGAGVPLLVLGEFGLGKTSLMMMFARGLLERDPSIVPIFVRLRQLKAAGTSVPLLTALRDYVRNTHGASGTATARDSIPSFRSSFWTSAISSESPPRRSSCT